MACFLKLIGISVQSFDGCLPVCAEVFVLYTFVFRRANHRNLATWYEKNMAHTSRLYVSTRSFSLTAISPYTRECSVEPSFTYCEKLCFLVKVQSYRAFFFYQIRIVNNLTPSEGILTNLVSIDSSKLGFMNIRNFALL